MTTIRILPQGGRRLFRRPSPRQKQIALRLGLLIVLAAFGLLVVRAQSAHADVPFYQPEASALPGSPGTVIRSEAMPFAPPNAAAYRILYRSIGLHGETIPVSGVLIVPKDGADDTSRKIVAWAHPTTGVATVCAPSLARTVYRQIQGLNDMLSKGFAVVATDYPGLGTPGVHPYLIGDSEGRAVLDSVRAARDLLHQKGVSQFAVWGHSQGGQAALYTDLLAKTYAPDLKLVGVVAAAPASDLTTLLSDDFDTSGGKGLTALALWSWSRLFDAGLGDTVEPDAMQTVDTLASGCIETIFDLLERKFQERPLNHDFLKIAYVSRAQPWHDVLKDNSPGVLPAQVPVMIVQGTSDTIVRPEVTSDYVRRLCAAGDHVELVLLPHVGHGFVAYDSAKEAVDWMSDRFAGRPAPTSCTASPLEEAARRPLPSAR